MTTQSASRPGKLFYHLKIVLLFLSVLMQGTNAYAHAKSENYAWINVETNQISGRFELNREDIQNKLKIKIDIAGSTRLESARASQQQVQNYLQQHFTISDTAGLMEIVFEDAQLFEGGEQFIQYPYRIERLPLDNKITVKSTIFLTPDMLANDKLHRSVVVVEYNRTTGGEYGEENVALVFSPDKSELDLDLSRPPKVLVWKDFLKQGLLHIAIGFDHILFIVLILLPSVLRSDNGHWAPQTGFTPVLWKTLKIVTTFTIAHSITLSMAALGLVSINTTVIEVVIALSIVALALTNLFPVPQMHSLFLIFVFGLFHGLGFASVMSDLQFRTVLIERILILFNIGVEIGQIVIVLALLPILYVLRNYSLYRQGVVVPISIFAAGIALYWTVERSGITI